MDTLVLVLFSFGGAGLVFFVLLLISAVCDKCWERCKVVQNANMVMTSDQV